MAPVEARGVTDPDLDLLLMGPLVAQCLHPGRRAGTAPARIHHQVRVQRLGGPGTPSKVDAGHARAVGRGHKAGNGAPRQDTNVIQRAHAPPDVPLEERPAHAHAVDAARELRPVAAGLEPSAIRGAIVGSGALDNQFLYQTREQLLHNDSAPGQQGVRVPALRHAFPGCGALWQRVALDHRHPLEMAGEHPRRQQPRHAAPDDEGVNAEPAPRAVEGIRVNRHFRLLSDPPRIDPPEGAVRWGFSGVSNQRQRDRIPCVFWQLSLQGNLAAISAGRIVRMNHFLLVRMD